MILIAALIAAVLGAVGSLSVEDLVQLLRDYGYKIIFALTFLEGETIVILAGIFSPKIGLEPWLIAVTAFSGSFLSDQVMFSLGKYKGETVLRYFPRIARNVDKASRLFKKYDTLLILGFRFVYGVRNVTPILLGISGVSHTKFFALNCIGAGVWAAAFTYGGLYAGTAFRHLIEKVGHGILYALLALLAVAGLIWYLRARNSVKRAREVADRCHFEAGLGLPKSEDCEVVADGPEAFAAYEAEKRRTAGDGEGGTK